MTELRRFSQAADNNRVPIARMLRRFLPSRPLLLEIGSGSGQHAIAIAPQLPDVTWQPSERPGDLADLAANLADHAPANVRPPVALDLQQTAWPLQRADAIFLANVVHIMSAELLEPLFAGAAARLPADGLLMFYGPFRYQGAFTTESNRRFDAWLKARDPASGIRDIERMDAEAAAVGLQRAADMPMPANNQFLVYRRSAAESADVHE